MSSLTAEDAILAIRHVIQEHGDRHYRLGGAGEIDGIIWFGKLLGWTWPPSYLAVLTKHDGALTGDVILLGFLESIDLLLVAHDRWHRPDGYWPVGSDGCGDYYVLSFAEQDANNGCPIKLLYTSDEEELIAPTYAAFVVRQLAEECKRHRCSLTADR